MGYVNCEQDWEHYQMVGGCQWHVAKFFGSPMEFDLIRWRTQQLSETRRLTQWVPTTEVLVRQLGRIKYGQQSRFPFGDT